MIFLQNHGVFVGADSEEEIAVLYGDMMEKLSAYCGRKGVDINEIIPGEADIDTVMTYAPQLRGYLRGSDNGKPVTVTSVGGFSIPRGPLTPDHLVYAKAFGVISENPDKGVIDDFIAQRSYPPRMVEVPGKAVFCSGKNRAVHLTHPFSALVISLASFMTILGLSSDASRIS